MGDVVDFEELKKRAQETADFKLMAKFSSKLPSNDPFDTSMLYDPRPPKWFLIIPVLMISGSIAGLVGMLEFLGWLSKVAYK